MNVEDVVLEITEMPKEGPRSRFRAASPKHPCSTVYGPTAEKARQNFIEINRSSFENACPECECPCASGCKAHFLGCSRAAKDFHY